MSPVDPANLRLLEAILFAAREPLNERTLAQRLPEGADLGALLEALQGDYAERGVNLVKAGGSWAFRTAPDLASRLNEERVVSRKLGRATVETLAIIAYHQPVTRAEIEEIRGVSISSGSLNALLEAGWIRPRGRRRAPGRPMTWGTTDAFLDHFGLESLNDLPGIEELKAAGLLDSSPAIEAYRAQTPAQAGPAPGADNGAPPERAGAEGDAAEPPDPDDDGETRAGDEASVEPPPGC